jgi:hypothetical protein
MRQTPALVLKSLRKEFSTVRKVNRDRERREQESRTVRLARGKNLPVRL